MNLLMVTHTPYGQHCNNMERSHMEEKNRMGSSDTEAPSMRKKNSRNLLARALVLDGKHGSQTPRLHGQF